MDKENDNDYFSKKKYPKAYYQKQTKLYRS